MTPQWDLRQHRTDCITLSPSVHHIACPVVVSWYVDTDVAISAAYLAIAGSQLFLSYGYLSRWQITYHNTRTQASTSSMQE